MGVNIKTIAKLANVSCTTVSRVLNNKPDVKDETRKLITDIINDHSYEPNAFAQAISSKRSNYVALIIPFNVNMAFVNPFYQEVMRGISIELYNRGYFLLFCYTHDVDYIASLFKQRRVDGFILLGTGKNINVIVSYLKEIGAPFVTNSNAYGEDVISVDIDNFYAAGLVVEHLISLGHKKIAFIKNGADLLSSSEDRLKGYINALERNDIPYDGNLVAVAGEISMDGGYLAMKQLLNNETPMTAVFIGADIMAIGAIKAIKESGKSIPSDMSVVGFDDIPLSEYTDPPLTTIKNLPFTKGKKAALLLTNILEPRNSNYTEKKKKIKSVLLDAELVVRDSTCSVKA